MERCGWCTKDELYINYHDNEWGVPVHDELKHFEFLTLEIFQAGLSWHTILKKRENFRSAFDGFNPEKICKYDEKKINELMNNSGIIRNINKIMAIINNAEKFIKIQEEIGSFDKYIWSFVDFKPIVNKWKNLAEIPVNTDLSDKISKDLIRRGFKFVGSTIIYAHLQAIGIVNDHLVSCFRYKELINII